MSELPPFCSPNIVEVSQSALTHNFTYFKEATGLNVFPVLRANAYGHGIDQVAHVLDPLRPPYIVVESPPEVAAVRSAAPEQPILVNGNMRLFDQSTLRALDEHGVTFCVRDTETIDRLGNLSHPVKVHLECEIGMHRYGVTMEDLPAVLASLKKSPNIELEGVMGHLPNVTSEDSRPVQEATTYFDEYVEKVKSDGFEPLYIHVARTGAAIRSYSAYANAMRIGAGIYGITPVSRNHPNYQAFGDLRPAMRFFSRIGTISAIRRGQTVGYGESYRAPKDMIIGTFPAGTYDGVHPTLGYENGVVIVDKRPCTVLGKVGLDHTTVKLGSWAAVGSEVTVYSPDPQSPASLESNYNRDPTFSIIAPPSPNVTYRLIP